jgi:hypothetical protein
MATRSPNAALRALATLAATACFMAAPAQAQVLRSASGVSIGVSVVDGAVRLSSESASVPAGVSTITWQLSGSGWRFAAGSIDFGDASAAFSCRVFSEGSAIACTRSGSAPKGSLAYRVRLSSGGGLTDLPQPSVYISLE